MAHCHGSTIHGLCYCAVFKDAAKFNQDISGWRVRNVKDAESMFEGASSFNCNGKSGMGKWEVYNITNMRKSECMDASVRACVYACV